MSKSYRTQQFTREQIEQMKREGKEVYEPTYSVRFEPWKAEEVYGCVEKLRGIGKEMKGEDPSVKQSSIMERAKEDPKLKEFSEKYLLYFDKLTDPAFVGEERYQKAIDAQLMVLAKMQQTGGSFESSTQEASKAVLDALSSGGLSSSGGEVVKE